MQENERRLRTGNSNSTHANHSYLNECLSLFQAVIGFDFHSGSSHPTFDGFVVCEEFADQVVAQWYADQEEVEEKEQKKYEARVYGNWKKLIKGLFIRERLKRKYDFGKDKAK